MKYRIGEIADMLKMSASALRYYEKEGLIPFVERTKGGKRLYAEENLDWLRIVDCLKNSGMPIKEIKKFIELCLEGDSTIDLRSEFIVRQLAEVRKQIAALQHHMELLEYKAWYYEKAKEAGTCSVHVNMPESEIPEKFLKFVFKHDSVAKL